MTTGSPRTRGTTSTSARPRASPLNPKLSIITPSLNQGRFIERTIQSVLDQGYENLEYLIVDGGSTDTSVETIRRYEDRIDWWVSEPDNGQTEAINKAITRATGDVIAYINSDDYYMPGAFDTALATLDESGAEWVAGAARIVDEHDQPLREVWRPEPPSVGELVWPRGRHWWLVGPWGVPQPSRSGAARYSTESGSFGRIFTTPLTPNSGCASPTQARCQS